MTQYYIAFLKGSWDQVAEAVAFLDEILALGYI